jgi:putative acetyltransferase
MFEKSTDMQPTQSHKFTRTNSVNPDFHILIKSLDEDLYHRNGEAQLQYRQYNLVDHINHVVLIYSGVKPVGCGCFKRFDDETIEIKRMFVVPEMREKKLATGLLHELEKWAIEEGFSKAVLETGLPQFESIRLYTAGGYVRTENYGQYADMEGSICFRKDLK